MSYDPLEDLLQDNPIPDLVPNDVMVTKEYRWYFEARLKQIKSDAKKIAAALSAK